MNYDRIDYVEENERFEPQTHHAVFKTDNTCEICGGAAIDKTWDLNGQEVNVITCEGCKIQMITTVDLKYKVMFCPRCSFNNSFKKYEDRRFWQCCNCHYVQT